jgi:hypothetical protein
MINGKGRRLPGKVDGKMLRIRLGLGMALAASALLVAGCYMPAPAPHAVLQVPASGSYVLDGVGVLPGDLAGALSARQAQAPSLVLEIHVSPQAGAASVSAAVSAAKQAHVRVAFAGGSSPQ